MNRMRPERQPDRREERMKLLVAGLETVIALAVLVGIIIFFSAASAEEYEGWIICTPGDYVNVRSGPGAKYECIGRFETGDRVTPDGKRRNGFLHCVRLGLESDEGWIHSGYIVDYEPRKVNREATVTGEGRVAARKNVGGKRTRWLQPGTKVFVYYRSADWCVTNRGYVQTEYLEVGND